MKHRVNGGKKQWHAGQMLGKLKRWLPKDAYCMIGVLREDIYNKESWNYVFGLASLASRTGVFSFA